MNEHPLYLVYQHVPRLLESRGLTTKTVVDTPRDQFISNITQVGYFRLDAEDANRRVLVLLILATNGKYTDHGPRLRDLITSLHFEDFAVEERFSEVMVVAPEEILKKKNMTDAVYGFRKPVEAAKKDGVAKKPEGKRADYYNIYPYAVLSIDIPRVRCIFPHVIADRAEVAAHLTRERLSISSLKRLLATEPLVIWIGARPGNVIRIQSPSETAREACDYYVVVRA